MSEFGYIAPKKKTAIRVFGTSASALKTQVEFLTGLNPGRKAVKTKETGKVSVTPEIYSTMKCADPCTGGGGGDGEGLLFCLILIIAFMAVFTIVWAVVMLAFSILTVGGFLKKRYRTLLVMETMNREFIGKLAVSVFRSGGVMEYPFGHERYDQWMKQAFNLFVRLKHIRQATLFFGSIWGFTEVYFRLYQFLISPSFDYHLWPFRFVMVIIILPMLLYSPILEIQFKNSRNAGEEMIMRLLTENPSFSPDYPMIFEEEPQIVAPLLVPKETRKTKKEKT